jgi:dGTP triphosphohydrolase
MSSDEFRRDFSGIVPDPPVGTPMETATEAWKMAYVARAAALRAEAKVAGILDGQLNLFEEYGRLQTNIARYFEQINRRFDELEKRLDAKVANVVDDARTSSHDLQSELEKMETILRNVKEHTVDSVRVKNMVDEQVEVVVSKKRLAELEKASADAFEDSKTRAAEKRNFKLTTWGLILATILGVVATHYIEHSNSATVTSQPSH